MPNLTLNLELLRSVLGPLVADEIEKLQDGVNLMAQQTNANPNGPVQPPPQISAVNVSAANGQHKIAIQDNNPVTRGIIYHLEYSYTPGFENPILSHTGPSKNHDVFLGNSTVYWRGFSQYLTGPPSEPVYFGGTSPAAVAGGGTIASAAALPSAGSGTEPSLNPQGAAGFGFDGERKTGAL